MPTSTIVTMETSPFKASARAKVDLIAWDPESPAHIERMFQQRVACGWKQDHVENWRGLQREGKMTLQWVVFSENDPEKESKLAQHLLKYPGEAMPILDTATALGGKPRVPSSRSFIPVGHISLDADQADASEGNYYITTLYISRAIQGSGLGRAAMDTLESEAVSEPLCAKVLLLDTLANSSADRPGVWEDIGMDPPLLSNEDWYARRGYKVFKFVENHIKQRDKNGKVWLLDGVFMRKTVSKIVRA